MKYCIAASVSWIIVDATSHVEGLQQQVGLDVWYYQVVLERQLFHVLRQVLAVRRDLVVLRYLEIRAHQAHHALAVTPATDKTR